MILIQAGGNPILDGLLNKSQNMLPLPCGMLTSSKVKSKIVGIKHDFME